MRVKAAPSLASYLDAIAQALVISWGTMLTEERGDFREPLSTPERAAVGEDQAAAASPPKSRTVLGRQPEGL